MAWGNSAQLPYYKPQAPEVPVADNTAAKIIASGGEAGVQAFVSMAIARQHDMLAHEQMMQEADLTAQKNELAREGMAQEYSFKRDQMAQDHELKQMLYGSYQTNAEANKTRAETALKAMLDRNKDASDAQASIIKTQAEFEARAKELGVNDPEKQTKDSTGFAAALLKLKDNYGDAPAYTGIPDKLKHWQTIADQQQVYLPTGAYKDSKGAWQGMTSQPVPVWRVVEGLKNEKTHDTWRNILIAAGHIQVNEKKEVVPGTGTTGIKNWIPFLRKKPETRKVTTETKDDFTKQVETDATRVDFSHEGSRLPMSVPKLTRPQAEKFGTGLDQPDEPLPAPDLPPEASAPTDTDITISHARKVLAVNPGAHDELVRRLQAMGIDPNRLTA